MKSLNVISTFMFTIPRYSGNPDDRPQRNKTKATQIRPPVKDLEVIYTLVEHRSLRLLYLDSLGVETIDKWQGRLGRCG